MALRAVVSLMAIITLISRGQCPVQPGEPIARVQALPLPYDQVAFERDGHEIARYYFSPYLNRPFVFPVIGPSGRSLTRLSHPGDPHTHGHHNSVWIGFSDVNGVDFWSDHGSDRGRIVHRWLERLDDGDDLASAVTAAEWLTSGGNVLLRERREVLVKLLAEGEWLLVIGLDLEPAGPAVVLKQGQFGPIGVRVAKSISVYFGGGLLRNSEGAEGENRIFLRRARWVDYSGPIAAGVWEGLTLMDHPLNPSYPSHFHVREDGWMGALLAQEAPLTLAPGERLQLRYGVYVHGGVPSPGRIDRVWERFAHSPLRPPCGPPLSLRDCLHGGWRKFDTPRLFRSQADCESFLRGEK